MTISVDEFDLLQYVFCRDCLQGYHIGDCMTDDVANANSTACRYDIDPSVSAAIIMNAIRSDRR